MAALVRFMIAFCLGLSLVLVREAAEVAARINSQSLSASRPTRATVTLESVASLTCTADVMKIRVNLTELGWLYNDTNPSSISLLDEGCGGTVIGDTWTLDNPHSQCYTQRKIDADFVHYRNALLYKEHGTGPIVREHRWRLDLNCHVRRHQQASLQYMVTETKNFEFQLKSDYTTEIHLYNDSSLQTELNTTNQVRARLGDDLYVKLDLKGDWNVRMHLQSCVARPLPQSLVSYTLIDHGCPTDSQTFIVYTVHNSTLIHFRVFEFYAGSSTVYVDCHVAYCAPNDNGPRCRARCN